MLEVVVPIEGFEDETSFEYEKLDEFFSKIKSVDSQKELRLMSFGALKSINFEFPDDFAQKMSITNYEDISIFYLFVIQKNSFDNSMNAFSPIVINHKANKIGQVRLNLEELGLEDLDKFLPNF